MHASGHVARATDLRRKTGSNVEEDFGNVWISRVYKRGNSEPHAFSLKCNRHSNGSECALVCRREFGISDMSRGEAKRRLKRWFVAGLDDTDWPSEQKRLSHSKIGGFQLRQFSDDKGGPSEEELNRLISEAAAAL